MEGWIESHLIFLKDEGKAENMLLKRNLVKETKETRFRYALIVQKGVGEDIPIPIKVAKILE